MTGKGEGVTEVDLEVADIMIIEVEEEVLEVAEEVEVATLIKSEVIQAVVKIEDTMMMIEDIIIMTETEDQEEIMMMRK